ncbi:MAG: Acetophenone carboxylase gamma subunit [Pelotomaculum sp. PtaU1.Bin035]|nr:MAG: Acetophenone carboxylase gamma subunit [Pelotomaculum sp. PtaU1.Bin035]
MKARIQVDVGGTFTDCLVVFGDRIVNAKHPTSPHSPVEPFMAVVTSCADKLNLKLEELLRMTLEIRYATNLAYNQLLERKGPNLALLATAGAEDAIYVGKGVHWTDGLYNKKRREIYPSAQRPVPLIPHSRCIGIRERLDSRGNVIRPLDEEHLRDLLNQLATQGVEGIVVSLLWSFLNPVHELRIQEIILNEFSKTCLHAVPVYLSSKVAPIRGEYQRTMTTIINAYLKPTMQDELVNISSHLRRRGYRGPLLMVQNNGRVADVWRATALATYNGGPVSGLMGSLQLAKQYSSKVITSDMGGTTFDIGIISGNSPLPHKLQPVIDHWSVGANMLEVCSIGAGGGTIVRLNREQGNILEIGPASAGAVPGPAAYDLGGIEPTITDADLVLGYLNPESFAGGKRRLNRERAIRAIRNRIAGPLGIDVIEAASQIRSTIDELMGHTILNETITRGHDPREFTLFAYGGAGPTHCCDYARVLEPARIITFPFSPTFCALGGVFLQYGQTYMHSKPFMLRSPLEGVFTDDYPGFNRIVSDLESQALEDIGLSLMEERPVDFILELDLKFNGQVHVKRIVSPRNNIGSRADVEAIYNAFVNVYSRSFSPFSLYPEGGVMIETFILHAMLPQEPVVLPAYPIGSTSAARALKERRDVFWIHEARWLSTPVYVFNLLQASNIIEGPAIVEDTYTTYVLPAGHRFTLDCHLAGIIERIN